MSKLEELKVPPFALPLRVVDVDVIVAHDYELVCHTDGATHRELEHIVGAVNMMPQLLKAMELIERLSRMETDGETQERTDYTDCMSGDDAAGTLSEVIASARQIREEK